MKLTIKQKLISGFAVMIVIILALGIISSVSMSSLKDRAKELTDHKIPSVVYLNEITNLLKTVDVLTMRNIVATDSDDMAGHLIEIESTIEDLTGRMTAYEANIVDPEQKELFISAENGFAEYTARLSKVLELSNVNDDEAALELQRESEAIMIGIIDSLDQLGDEYIAGMTDIAEQQTSEAEASQKTALVSVAIAVLLGIALSLLIARSITVPLSRMIQQVDTVANGQLNTLDELPTDLKGELGRMAVSLHRMGSNQRDILLEVSRTAGALAASAEEFKSVAQESAHGAEHSANSMQRMAEMSETQLATSRSGGELMQRMLEKIVVIRDRVGETSEAAEHASSRSQEGGQVVGEAVHQMESTTAGMVVMTEAVDMLNRRSNEIGTIVQLITGIAKQTNLLALNASIEAARAGEHGKGFAVVASEVGKLAEQSSASAAQIIDMIDMVRSDAERLSQVIAKATGQVSAGSEAIRATGDLFGNIRETVGRVGLQSEQAVQASGEMVQVVETVASSIMEGGVKMERTAEEIQNVSAVSQQQAAAMQEMSASAVSLSEMAGELEHLVARFQL